MLTTLNIVYNNEHKEYTTKGITIEHLSKGHCINNADKDTMDQQILY